MVVLLQADLAVLYTLFTTRAHKQTQHTQAAQAGGVQAMVSLLQADLGAARAEAEQCKTEAAEAKSNGEEAEGRVSDLQDR